MHFWDYVRCGVYSRAALIGRKVIANFVTTANAISCKKLRMTVACFRLSVNLNVTVTMEMRIAEVLERTEQQSHEI